jgi:hypothetical protein
MNEIITPNNKQSNQSQPQSQQTVASIAINIPPLQVDMTKVVRILFDKIRRLEERLQHLEQTQQNRTPH